jgi:hypothetical protein
MDFGRKDRRKGSVTLKLEKGVICFCLSGTGSKAGAGSKKKRSSFLAQLCSNTLNASIELLKPWFFWTQRCLT